GTHCSDKSCNQLDFLPFKCQACALPYCQHHWKPQQHNCSKYDPVKADNRIPSCPLCNQPVSFPVGTDPNPAMDRHLSTECPVLNSDGTAKSSPAGAKKQQPPGSMPVCNHRRCQTKMIAPIRCSDCGGEFCPSHRYSKDHACEGGNPSNKAASTSTNTIKSKLASGPPPPGSAGNPIIIDDDDDDDGDVQVISSNKSAKPKIGIAGIPVGKVDRRSEAERESAKKALEARAKKGLLTEEEKLRYATEKARQAKEGNKKQDGCAMS
ncbi:hypothetical protein T439DRAFT_286529, partial [Meredithblackwellia eburnea MCA 4105]